MGSTTSPTTRRSTASSPNASCTTTAGAPVASSTPPSGSRKGMDDRQVTPTRRNQRILIAPQGPPARKGAACQHHPTTTGRQGHLPSSSPSSRGRFDGYSLRVHAISLRGGFLRRVENRHDGAAPEALNNRTKKSLQGIMAASEDTLVSTDFKGDAHSSSWIWSSPRSSAATCQGRGLVRQRVGPTRAGWQIWPDYVARKGCNGPFPRSPLPCGRGSVRDARI